MKKCAMCHVKKDLKEFHNKTNGYCKNCLKVYTKTYYLKHKEKVQQYKKDYFQKNKEKIREKVREWAKNNPEKAKEKAKRNYLKRKAKLLSSWQINF